MLVASLLKKEILASRVLTRLPWSQGMIHQRMSSTITFLAGGNGLSNFSEASRDGVKGMENKYVLTSFRWLISFLVL